MKNYYFILIIVVSILSGCSQYDSEIELINTELNNLRDTATNDKNELSQHFDDVDIRISEINAKLDIIEDELSDLNSKVESIDVSTIMKSVEDIESEVLFIENIIWKDNLFDIEDVNIGDRVGKMKIVDITNYKGTALHFEGEVLVKGHFEIIKDNPMTPDGVAFYVEDKSGYLPRARGDSRILWFTFTNVDDAYDMFSEYKSSDEISIMIDEYVLTLSATAAVNSAKIISVITD